MKNPKLIALAVAVLLLAIVVLQNQQPSKTRVLFFTIEMSHALLLFVTLLVGFALGLVARRPLRGDKKGEKPSEEGA